MFKHNLLTSYRLLIRNKRYALINVIGMSIGLTTVLLAIAFYQFEHSYDQLPSQSSVGRIILQDQNRATDYLPYQMGQELSESIPEIAEYTRLKTSTLQSVITLQSYPDKAFDESGIAFTDTNFFTFFERGFLIGSERRFSQVSNSVVLTESTAKRYFGDKNPIGELIEIKKDGHLMEVVGVVRDFPSNSSLQFDLICSIENLKSHSQQQMYFNPAYRSFQTYVKAGTGADYSLLNQKAASFATDNYSGDQRSIGLKVEPLDEIHLKSEVFPTFYAMQGDEQLINWLLGISIVILILGMINYSNLSLAIAFKQVKGVGIRKSIGVSRKVIFNQYITDTLLTCFLVLILSVLLFEFSLPVFENFVERSFIHSIDQRRSLYLLAILLCTVSGIFAGLYRAVMLSRIRPTALLKGDKGIPSLSRLKSILLWVQFSMAFILMSTAFYMNSQLNFVLNKDLGANIDHKIVLRSVNSKIPTLKNELLRIEGVNGVASSTFYPGMKNPGGSKKSIDFITGVEDQYISLLGIDDSFLSLYDINISDSNGLSQATLFSDQSDFVLINKTAEALFGSENPIGVKIKPIFNGQNEFNIQGVAADINIASLRDEITPMAFIPISKVYSSKYMSISYSQSQDPYELLAQIEETYRQVLPEEPFEPIILRDQINQLYQEELKMKSLVNFLTGISLFITLAGILGIVISNTESNLKEISIRKVLGAGFWQLQIIQNIRLLRLLIFSLLCGIPMGILIIDYWKTDFIYRIDISPELFIGSACIITISVLLVSSLLTAKASNVNPAQTLRQE